MKKIHTFELMPEEIKRFKARDFERRPPGTLRRDFEILLRLIGDQGMPVTPAHLFTMNCLQTISRSLTHPLELRLKRAAQKSYPYINGLYLLLRATGISWSACWRRMSIAGEHYLDELAQTRSLARIPPVSWLMPKSPRSSPKSG